MDLGPLSPPFSVCVAAVDFRACEEEIGAETLVEEEQQSKKMEAGSYGSTSSGPVRSQRRSSGRTAPYRADAPGLLGAVAGYVARIFSPGPARRASRLSRPEQNGNSEGERATTTTAAAAAAAAATAALPQYNAERRENGRRENRGGGEDRATVVESAPGEGFAALPTPALSLPADEAAEEELFLRLLEKRRRASLTPRGRTPVRSSATPADVVRALGRRTPTRPSPAPRAAPPSPWPGSRLPSSVRPPPPTVSPFSLSAPPPISLSLCRFLCSIALSHTVFSVSFDVLPLLYSDILSLPLSLSL